MIRRFILFAFFVLTPAAGVAAPSVQEITTEKGLSAWLVQDKRLPLISVHFAFRGGVETDPEDKQGLATLAAALLTQGAGPYDAKAFQDRLAASSIQLSFDAGRDAFFGRMKTLSREKDEAFRLLSFSVAKARISQEDFERERTKQRASLRFRLSDPSWQARYALFSHVFGSHPYGYRALGSDRTLAALTRDDVIRFTKERLARDTLMISVVGDIDARTLSEKLDKAFGELPEKAASQDISFSEWNKKTKTICVTQKGEQTNFVFAGPMIGRVHPDWHAALVANRILGGGGFDSRLMAKMRKEEGLTYGISTTLASMEKASMVVGALAVDNAKAGKAWERVLEIWGDLAENGPSAREVEAAKAHMIGAWPLAMGTTDALAATLLDIQKDGLGVAYLEKRKDYLNGVSHDDVTRVLREYFNPTSLSAAAAGAPEGLECGRVRKETEE